MLRHLAQPFDAGKFRRGGPLWPPGFFVMNNRAGTGACPYATCNGVVDDAQLLFGEQLDKIALGLDEAGDVGILRAEIGNDLVLLGARRQCDWKCAECCWIQVGHG